MSVCVCVCVCVTWSLTGQRVGLILQHLAVSVARASLLHLSYSFDRLISPGDLSKDCFVEKQVVGLLCVGYTAARVRIVPDA